jgi:hypothetical protein
MRGDQRDEARPRVTTPVRVCSSPRCRSTTRPSLRRRHLRLSRRGTGNASCGCATSGTDAASVGVAVVLPMRVISCVSAPEHDRDNVARASATTSARAAHAVVRPRDRRVDAARAGHERPIRVAGHRVPQAGHRRVRLDVVRRRGDPCVVDVDGERAGRRVRVGRSAAATEARVRVGVPGVGGFGVLGTGCRFAHAMSLSAFLALADAPGTSPLSGTNALCVLVASVCRLLTAELFGVPSVAMTACT